MKKTLFILILWALNSCGGSSSENKIVGIKSVDLSALRKDFPLFLVALQAEGLSTSKISTLLKCMQPKISDELGEIARLGIIAPSAMECVTEADPKTLEAVSAAATKIIIESFKKEELANITTAEIKQIFSALSKAIVDKAESTEIATSKIEGMIDKIVTAVVEKAQSTELEVKQIDYILLGIAKGIGESVASMPATVATELLKKLPKELAALEAKYPELIKFGEISVELSYELIAPLRSAVSTDALVAITRELTIVFDSAEVTASLEDMAANRPVLYDIIFNNGAAEATGDSIPIAVSYDAVSTTHISISTDSDCESNTNWVTLPQETYDTSYLTDGAITLYVRFANQSVSPTTFSRTCLERSFTFNDSSSGASGSDGDDTPTPDPTYPDLSASSGSLGNIWLTETFDKTITISNNGDADATGCETPSLSNGTYFSIQSTTCTATIAAGGSCQVVVRGLGASSGTHTDGLLISCSNGELVDASGQELTASIVSPGVLSSNPSNNASGVDPNQNITLNFSHPITVPENELEDANLNHKRDNFLLKPVGSWVPYEVDITYVGPVVNSSGQTEYQIKLDPFMYLEASTEYELIIQTELGMEDGYSLASPQTINFTTGAVLVGTAGFASNETTAEISGRCSENVDSLTFVLTNTTDAATKTVTRNDTDCDDGLWEATLDIGDYGEVAKELTLEITGTNTSSSKSSVATVDIQRCADTYITAVDGSFTAEEGDGSTETPFLISTADQLYDIEASSGKEYKLVDDIDLSCIDWDVGSINHVIDGNGHVVKNLTRHHHDGFTTDNTNTIKNIGFVDFRIVGDLSGAGGLLGTESDKTYNLFATGHYIEPDYNAGGIMQNSGIMAGIHAQIHLWQDPGTTNNGFVGGIASNCRSNIGQMLNVHFSGSMMMRNSVYGGICAAIGDYTVGHSNDKVVALSYVSNSGSIASDSNYVAGIVGSQWEPYADSQDLRASVRYAHNSGVITGASYVGGLGGGYSSYSSRGEFSFVSNTGTIRALSGIATGICYYCEVNQGYNTGDVGVDGGSTHAYGISHTYAMNSYSTGAIYGSSERFGISSGTLNESVFNSYSTCEDCEDSDCGSDDSPYPADPETECTVDGDGRGYGNGVDETLDNLIANGFLNEDETKSKLFDTYALEHNLLWTKESGELPTFVYPEPCYGIHDVVANSSHTGSPKEIGTLEDLFGVATAGQSNSYILTADIDFAKTVSGRRYCADWTGLSSFSGTFDGDNHSIKNITRFTTIHDNHSFIDSNSGTVKNITIESQNFHGLAAGGIAAQNSGTMTNVHVANSRIFTNNNQRGGGLVGEVTSSSSVIDGCSVKNSIIIGRAAGSIVGRHASSTATVDQCHASKNLIFGIYDPNVGGMFGYFSGVANELQGDNLYVYSEVYYNSTRAHGGYAGDCTTGSSTDILIDAVQVAAGPRQEIVGALCGDANSHTFNRVIALGTQNYYQEEHTQAALGFVGTSNSVTDVYFENGIDSCTGSACDDGVLSSIKGWDPTKLFLDASSGADYSNYSSSGLWNVGSGYGYTPARWDGEYDGEVPQLIFASP